LALAFFAAAVVAGGCTTSSDTTGGAGASGGAGGSGSSYTPTGNGKRIGEADACALLIKGVESNISRLQCPPATMKACPEFIRSSTAPACSEYDEGAIQGCVSYYGSYSSCADFAARPCLILYFKDSAPKGCAATDGGTDAPTTDAPATDAPVTDAPATDAPATDAPVTDAPATDAPSTDAPATDAPVNDGATTDAPAD
jgi:hypothetical protein